jgi:hypothetical protein
MIGRLHHLSRQCGGTSHAPLGRTIPETLLATADEVRGRESVPKPSSLQWQRWCPRRASSPKFQI